MDSRIPLFIHLWAPLVCAQPFFVELPSGKAECPPTLGFTETGKQITRSLRLEEDISPQDFITYAAHRPSCAPYTPWQEGNGDPGIKCPPEDLYDTLQKYGWIDEKSLSAASYFDCIIILGGMIPGMRDRIHLVLHLLREQKILGEPKICFLTSGRPLTAYDGKGFSQELQEHGCSATESSAARYLWEGIVPSRYAFKCEFVNTTDGHSDQNVGTRETMDSCIHWIQSQANSNSWRILLVGSQPWLQHQRLVFEHILRLCFPQFFRDGGLLEVIGIPAPTMYFKSGARRSEAFKINVLWASVARTANEEREILELMNPGLFSSSSQPATPAASPARPSGAAVPCSSTLSPDHSTSIEDK
ncbi:MAG: hypothetical protein LBD54_00460 [Puniceicoccales bacterium]|jgi:hypothetical protein|nr:hypothetical protein [Puniceicoccales bacterium]